LQSGAQFYIAQLLRVAGSPDGMWRRRSRFSE